MTLSSAIRRSDRAIGILDSFFPTSVYRHPESIERLRPDPRSATLVRRGRRKVIRTVDEHRLSAYALGQRLRELRLERGMRQEDLAGLCGIARPNIARIERGKHLPSMKTIRRLSDALHVSPAAFLEMPSVAVGGEDRILAESGLTDWSAALEREDRLVR